MVPACPVCAVPLQLLCPFLLEPPSHPSVSFKHVFIFVKVVSLIELNDILLIAMRYGRNSDRQEPEEKGVDSGLTSYRHDPEQMTQTF